jgi:hypothetical protein
MHSLDVGCVAVWRAIPGVSALVDGTAGLAATVVGSRW